MIEVRIPRMPPKSISPNKKREFFSESEKLKIKEWYQSHEGAPLNLDELSALIDRPKTSVARVARSLGLTSTRRSRGGRRNDNIYGTMEEFRRLLPQLRREAIKKYGHPRGMLGKKHTQENIDKMKAGLRKYNESVTPEMKRDKAMRATLTKIARYGTGAPQLFVNGEITNPYSRGHRGYIDDIPGIFFRSGWEANYARYLDWLKDNGEIEGWKYECKTFVFEGVTRAPYTYMPDFEVTEKNGDIVYHEVKGWMNPQSKSKLKRMKKFYPEVTIIIVDEPAYKAIAKWSAAIPFWGDMPKAKEKT